MRILGWPLFALLALALTAASCGGAATSTAPVRVESSGAEGPRPVRIDAADASSDAATIPQPPPPPPGEAPLSSTPTDAPPVEAPGA